MDCVIDGLLFREEQETIQAIEELVRGRFFFGKVDMKLLLPEGDWAPWIQEMPEGYSKKAAERLAGVVAAGDAAVRDRLALREFSRIWREVNA